MESVAVPLHSLKHWLAGSATPDTAYDVEGGEKPAKEDRHDGIRPCLLWRGRDRSTVAAFADAILPGDVVVLPAAYGLASLAQTLPDHPEKVGLGAAKADLWEWALESAGKRRVLRIHRGLWEPWLECPSAKKLIAYAEEFDGEREFLWNLIDEIIAYQPAEEAAAPTLPEWRLAHIRSMPRNARIDSHPGGGLILSERGGTSVAAEHDLFADDDDLNSVAGEAISLRTHTAAVVSAIQKMAGHCLPTKFLRPLEVAAEWHDAGKLDERFQFLLRTGDEIAVATSDPLAKSPGLPLSSDRRQALREAASLPDGFRHEMLSMQLAERFATFPDDLGGALVLHLIASHHGHARPFAPLSLDAKAPPIDVTFADVAIKVSPQERAAFVPAYRIDSGIADRFWKLVRCYGWWGLTYLEAILRLADWYGSELAPREEEPVK